MERAISVEEKIKRAEEIYNKRHQNIIRPNTARVNVNNKRDYKLFKKMVIQIIVCLAIYSVFYLISHNEYIFSENCRNKIQEILSYDTNLREIYGMCKQQIESIFKEKENEESNEVYEETKQEEQTKNSDEVEEKTEEQVDSSKEEPLMEESIGGAEEIIEENKEEPQEELSDMEKMCIEAKKTTSFIVPVSGIVSSPFGYRTSENENIPKNHTGVDIAASKGTQILSATDGTVILSSAEGDYGNHLKIQIGDLILIYAHCNKLYVTQGDSVKQGQVIAEVGSTGNSTGPHLHFGILKGDTYLNPQLIIEI